MDAKPLNYCGAHALTEKFLPKYSGWITHLAMFAHRIPILKTLSQHLRGLSSLYQQSEITVRDWLHLVVTASDRS